MYLPFEDELTLAGDSLDVLVELHHRDVLRQVANEDGLHVLVGLGLLGLLRATGSEEITRPLLVQEPGKGCSNASSKGSEGTDLALAGLLSLLPDLLDEK